MALRLTLASKNFMSYFKDIVFEIIVKNKSGLLKLCQRMAIFEDFETFFMLIGIFIFERVVLCAQWSYIMREGIKMTF